MNYKAEKCEVYIAGEKVEGFTLKELTEPPPEGESIFKIVARVAQDMGLDPAKVLADMNAAQKLNDKRERAALYQAQRNEQHPNRKTRRAARAR
jgi:hypothetical protein